MNKRPPSTLFRVVFSLLLCSALISGTLAGGLADMVLPIKALVLKARAAFEVTTAYDFGTPTVDPGPAPSMNSDSRGGIWSADEVADIAQADNIAAGNSPALDPGAFNASALGDPGNNLVWSKFGTYGPSANHLGGWGTTGGSTTGGGTGEVSSPYTGIETPSNGFPAAISPGGSTPGGGTTGAVDGGTTGQGGGTTGGTTGSSSTPPTGSHTGGAFPWEGNGPGGGSEFASGLVNTLTGNRLTTVPVVSWSGPGGMGINLTLYQNSQEAFDCGWGMNWRSSYDMLVIYNGQSTAEDGNTYKKATVTYPTGKKIEFFNRQNLAAGVDPSNVFYPPKGFYDILVRTGENNWQLRSPDGTVCTLDGVPYNVGTIVNSGAWLTNIKNRHNKSIIINRTNRVINYVEDPSGHRLTFTSQLIQLANSYTVKVQYYYTFVSAGNGDNRVWSFDTGSFSNYTGPKLLRKVSWPVDATNQVAPCESFAYDPVIFYNLVTEVDRAGKTWTCGYNATRGLSWFKDPLGNQYDYTYSATNTVLTLPRRMTNGVRRTRTDFYSGGMLYATQDEAGSQVTVTQRDTYYNPTQVKDQRGATSYATYNVPDNPIGPTQGSGTLASSQDPVQHGLNISDVYSYTLSNDLNFATTGLGFTTTYNYDSSGHGDLLSAVDATGRTLFTNSYNEHGDPVTSVVGPATTSYTYDSWSRIASVTTPDGTTSVTSYSYTDKPAVITDPQGRSLTVSYDLSGRVVGVTRSSDGANILLGLDKMNRAISVRDWLGRYTSFTYDDNGRLTLKSRPDGHGESYGYNNLNEVTSITDGNGQSRIYDYAPRGEVAFLLYPDLASEWYTYDEAGSQTGRTDGMGQHTAYAYDTRGLLTSVNYATGTGVSLAYDSDGRRVTMTDSTGPTSWSYDAAGREVSFTQAGQSAITYAYDSCGRRTSMSQGGSNVSNYFYTAHRLTSITKNPESETTSFAYDSYGRLSRQTNLNGTTTDYGYDSSNRVNDVWHKTSGASSLSHEAYVYDAGGNLTSKAVDGTTTSYTYDVLDQLLSETVGSSATSYTYDFNGNRKTKTAPGLSETYNYLGSDKDQLSSITGPSGSLIKSYAYDANGRCTSVTNSSNQITRLNYDYEDRVSSITTASSPYSGQTTIQSNVYNGLDARVSKTTTSGTQVFKRAGAHVTAPLLSDGTNTFNPGISMKNSSGTQVQHADRLGTNRLHTNSSQAVSGTQTYDAFGMAVSSTGIKNPLGFAGDYGYQEDSETGLKLLGHRLYDPSIGRFLERDPIGSGMNWYGYCRNNPLVWLDPLGFMSTAVAAPAAASGGALTPAEMPTIIAGAQKGMAAAASLAKPINIIRAFLASLVALIAGDATCERGERKKSPKRVAIGETMARVTPAAAALGAETFPDQPGPFNQTVWMEANRAWINQQMDARAEIFDIGLDTGRKILSPFYAMEREEIKKRHCPTIGWYWPPTEAKRSQKSGFLGIK